MRSCVFLSTLMQGNLLSRNNSISCSLLNSLSYSLFTLHFSRFLLHFYYFQLLEKNSSRNIEENWETHSIIYWNYHLENYPFFVKFWLYWKFLHWKASFFTSKFRLFRLGSFTDIWIALIDFRNFGRSFVDFKLSPLNS